MVFPLILIPINIKKKSVEKNTKCELKLRKQKKQKCLSTFDPNHFQVIRRRKVYARFPETDDEKVMCVFKYVCSIFRSDPSH